MDRAWVPASSVLIRADELLPGDVLVCPACQLPVEVDRSGRGFKHRRHVSTNECESYNPLMNGGLPRGLDPQRELYRIFGVPPGCGLDALSERMRSLRLHWAPDQRPPEERPHVDRALRNFVHIYNQLRERVELGDTESPGSPGVGDSVDNDEEGFQRETEQLRQENEVLKQQAERAKREADAAKKKAAAAQRRAKDAAREAEEARLRELQKEAEAAAWKKTAKAAGPWVSSQPQPAVHDPRPQPTPPPPPPPPPQQPPFAAEAHRRSMGMSVSALLAPIAAGLAWAGISPVIFSLAGVVLGVRGYWRSLRLVSPGGSRFFSTVGILGSGLLLGSLVVQSLGNSGGPPASQSGASAVSPTSLPVVAQTPPEASPPGPEAAAPPVSIPDEAIGSTAISSPEPVRTPVDSHDMASGRESANFPDGIHETAPATGLVPFGDPGKMGLMTLDGRVVLRPSLDAIEQPREGLAAARFKGKWGFVDSRGTWAVPAQYEEVRSFNGDVAPALRDSSWGLVDGRGRWVKQPFAEQIGEFRAGFAVATQGGHVGLINRAGSWICSPLFDEILLGDTAAATRSGNVWGRLSFTGQTQTFRAISQLGPFVAGLARAKQGDRWGYVDESGVFVVSPVYADARDFSEALAAVRTTAGWLFIGTDGHTVIPGPFRDAIPFSEELAAIRSGELVGYINHSGTWVIAPQFRIATSFRGGASRGLVGNEWVTIDRSGRRLVPSASFQ